MRPLIALGDGHIVRRHHAVQLGIVGCVCTITSPRQASLSDKDYYSWTDAQRFEYFIRETQYGRELNALPEALRVGWLLGLMDRFAGQYFDCFDRAVHVFRPQAIEMQRWWPRWISIDSGFAHPAAVHWHAKMDDGHVLTYRELEGAGIDEPELGKKIGTLSECDPSMRMVCISPDANAKRGSARTVIEQIGEALGHSGLPYPEVADDDRIGGARLCYNLLKPTFHH